MEASNDDLGQLHFLTGRLDTLDLLNAHHQNDTEWRNRDEPSEIHADFAKGANGDVCSRRKSIK